MKKIAFLAILTIAMISGISAQADSFIIISPHAGVVLSPNGEFLRGAGAGVDLQLNLLGLLYPGVQAQVEYEPAFGSLNAMGLVTLGLGSNFWIGAGQSFAITESTVGEIDYQLGDFPNTLALGVAFELLPMGESTALQLLAQLSYTHRKSLGTGDEFTDALADDLGILAGLKAYAGVRLALGL